MAAILIPYSLILILKNESKIVSTIRLVDTAKRDCKVIDNVTDMTSG